MRYLYYMEHFETQLTPDKSVLLTNIIQIELAQLHGESIDAFIERHASDFRNTITAHPELIEKFEQDHDAALQEIEQYVYH